ncbi:MAG: cupredoxin domain-containing protein [Pseudobdellovibrio sp.]
MKLLIVFLATGVLSFSVFAKDVVKPLNIELTVTEKGFEPDKIDVTPDQPVQLNVTRKTDDTCATAIQIPSMKIKKELPLNKTVAIKLGKLKKGEIRFGCGMKMMDSGMIYVK